MIVHAKFNVSKFSLCKKIVEKIFTNIMYWRNWRKFSPGKNFCVYSLNNYCMITQDYPSIPSCLIPTPIPSFSLTKKLAPCMHAAVDQSHPQTPPQKGGKDLGTSKHILGCVLSAVTYFQVNQSDCSFSIVIWSLTAGLYQHLCCTYKFESPMLGIDVSYLRFRFIGGVDSETAKPRRCSLVPRPFPPFWGEVWGLDYYRQDNIICT